MKKSRMVFCVIVLITISNCVSGGMVTYQQWTFDDADNPALPEVSDNPFGTAAATITVNGISCGMQPGWYATFLGHYGVWASNETTATLVIPNNPVLAGYKDIWLEMSFRTVLLDAEITAVVPSPSQGVIEVSKTIAPTVDEYGYLDGWYKLNIQWRIYPNPQEETIYLRVHDSGADIDYITVQTECVPEPASLFLMGMGMIIGVRRGKHNGGDKE